MPTLLLCCQASDPEGTQTLAIMVELSPKIIELMLDNIHMVGTYKELNLGYNAIELVDKTTTVFDLREDTDAQFSPEVEAIVRSLSRDGIITLDDESRKVLLRELKGQSVAECVFRAVEGGVHWRLKLLNSNVVYDSMQVSDSRLKTER